MDTQHFGFKRIGQLLYVDGKEDEHLTDIFNGGFDLTAQMEERLYRQYWGKLMGVARRYVLDKETAREIVNDSFVKAFRKLSTFKGEGPDKSIILNAWLVRITVNTAIDRLRTQRTSPELLSLDEMERAPLVEIDDSLEVDDILQLLQRLPALHRIVFNLYELEGYSHEEIGKLMEIPTSSSRVYLAKAKQGLRVLYSKYYGGRHDG
ncbi:RNA polymerase sigma factor [Parapedobacter koreensis]|uniref:RNA polymerase sigma-70 factor, ECF subfamily n=1 Tax=Parapedobacter koreensis TaxID=332977 RepID=A0A1H7LJ80_9SPHI|nr:sigma-70 family RNA polymerase sigma factor [Parapedobacter koreensis]SEK98976.1 RNA polymerase sigma-70 factor, ECF subfamily [Parapedobacter koreensis]